MAVALVRFLNHILPDSRNYVTVRLYDIARLGEIAVVRQANTAWIYTVHA